jgi:GTP-binding protein Era
MSDLPSESETPSETSKELGHSGFVGLVGLPNAGKSTLMNGALQVKLSIVSKKPQTTRNRILGVLNVPDLQVALVDTPGIHRARGRMHNTMVQVAKDTIGEVDAACWVVDASWLVKKGSVLPAEKIFSKGLKYMATLLEKEEQVVVVLNKIDLFPRHLLLPLLAIFQERLPQAHLVPLSAKTKDGLDVLFEVFRKILPQGEPLYPEDVLTDQTERFLAAERIREKVFLLTNQEVPYSVAVEIQGFKETPKRTEIYARIWVEKESQKGILIGKKGAKIKMIGTQSRKELQELFGRRIHLDLIVSVRNNWSNDPRRLRELGF